MSDTATPPAAASLLAPAFLRGLGSLELIARQVVEGFVTGRHKSPFKGFSSEFAEHREYAAGDDIRDLDWRVYAKSDRYYIKQYEEETNLRCYLLVDASGSMAYGEGGVAGGDGAGSARRRWRWPWALARSERHDPRRQAAIGKFRYVQYLSACLAYLMLHQSDAVGLVTYDTRVRQNIPARSRANHIHALLQVLSEAAPGAETGLAPVIHEMAERVRRRAMMILLSDCLDDVSALLNALQHLRYSRHEVIVMHVMHYDELTFPFSSWAEFRNLEVPGDKLQLDPPGLRQVYLERVTAFRQQLADGCGRLGVDYVPMDTAEPMDLALRSYLAFRAEH